MKLNEKQLFEAVYMITYQMATGIKEGQRIPLKNGFYLYSYIDADFLAFGNSEAEILCVQYDPISKDIVLTDLVDLELN